MERKTAHDFDQELLILFDAYVHGAHRPPRLSRQGRQVRRRRRDRRDAARSAEPEVRRGAGDQARRPAHQGAVRRVRRRRRATARCAATWPQPAKPAGKLPAVLVVHENRGLNPHIEDIARRLALDNFVAFAPDALFPLGGYPGDEDKARELFPKLDQAKTREDFVAAADWLQARARDATASSASSASATAAASSTCWRRACRTWPPACRSTAARPTVEDVPKIKAPLLIHFARKRRAHQRRLAGVRDGAEGGRTCRYERFMYPGTQHGFNNDTTPRYDDAAAKLAWERTIAHFNKYLR